MKQDVNMIMCVPVTHTFMLFIQFQPTSVRICFVNHKKYVFLFLKH